MLRLMLRAAMIFIESACCRYAAALRALLAAADVPCASAYTPFIRMLRCHTLMIFAAPAAAYLRTHTMLTFSLLLMLPPPAAARYAVAASFATPLIAAVTQVAEKNSSRQNRTPSAVFFCAVDDATHSAR